MLQSLAIIPVAAAAIFDSGGRVLLQRRRTGGAHGGLWEFPGGKIEPGETPESALVREIAEELAIALEPGALAPLAYAADRRLPPEPRDPHLILLFACHGWTGEPRPLAAEEIGWFAPQDLPRLAMPPLDVPLAEALVRSL